MGEAVWRARPLIWLASEEAANTPTLRQSPGFLLRHARDLAGRAFGAWIDSMVPPQCLICGAWIPATNALCASCWPTLRFIDRPLCDACGLPLEFVAAAEPLCGACARAHPPFARARAALVYDEASSRLILGFKNGDRTDTVPAFAQWMARAGSELLAEADLLVPVPLHWTRLIARRFNQAALIAHAIGRRTGVPVAPDALVRRQRTEKLGHLGARARARTVAGVFALRPRLRRRIAGRRVILVDDVLTTGSTASGCVAALLEGGAARVEVLALARAGRDATVQR
jgi:ComF family protein